MVEVLMRHRIAEHVHDGSRTPEELAAATGLPERGLYRLLRASTGLGLMTRDGDGRFALTPLGEMLEAWQGAEWGFDALAAFPEALETGRSGMEVAHGMSTFEFFEQHPEAGAKFDRLMQDINAGEQEAVAEAYPFGGVELLVDVGGGNGSMLATLLSRHPACAGSCSTSHPSSAVARPPSRRTRTATTRWEATSSTPSRRARTSTSCRTSSTTGPRTAASGFSRAAAARCGPAGACWSSRWSSHPTTARTRARCRTW